MSSHKTLRRLTLQAGASFAALALAAPAAHAQAEAEAGEVQRQLDALKAQVAVQSEQLARQQAALAAAQSALQRQAQAQRSTDERFGALLNEREAMLSTLRAAGYDIVSAPAPALAAAQPATAAPPAGSAGSAPPRPAVGEAPPEEPPKTTVAAVPQEVSVLTPRGHLVLEPDAEYTLSSSNLLVFRGVEIVPGVQLGVIEASNTVRAAEAASASVRYGLTRRIELSAVAPMVWRQDRVSIVQQRNEQVTRELQLHSYGLGDVEFGARYQLNELRRNRPVFILGLRAKSDTGSNPYLVHRDEFGAETQLATGSGFWGLESSLTALYPSDPAVLFASVSYMQNFGKSFHQNIGGAVLNRVDPGDSFGLTAGFGFAVNANFSYSVGYKYNLIFPTTVDLGGDLERSHRLQVGTVVLGASYRLSNRITLAAAFEIGATADAPDTHITLRLPISF